MIYMWVQLEGILPKLWPSLDRLFVLPYQLQDLLFGTIKPKRRKRKK